MRIAVLVLIASAATFAQGPTVPHRMNFAGMTLIIRDDARKEIQKDVDLFTQSPKYFNIKVERARLYFPIIEKIFESERVPDDFKYLVIQESALIPDAVSTSNAVGFWQFKDFTAVEMGLRVDREIDERKNIVSASRAAAKYIKKNNFYFNNWLYALQAYQMGAGGVMQAVNNYESGAKHMEITSKTYWYVKKFLAHKIAYENAIRGPAQVKAILYENKSKTKLSQLASDFAIDEDELKSYNKWVLKNAIPDDRVYTVLIPATGDSRALERTVAKHDNNTSDVLTTTASVPTPRKSKRRSTISKSEYVFINGVPALKARQGENASRFANRVGIDISYFLKYNDLDITDPLIAGEYYFVKRKNVRASTRRHVASKDETLWSVSQQYGVQLQKLRKYNSGLANGPLREGTTVLLTKNQKVNQPIDDSMPVLEVSQSEAFSWSVKPEEVEVSNELRIIEPEVIPRKEEALPEPVVVRPEPTNEEPVKAENKSEESGTHTIIQGETLYSISRQYGVTVKDLTSWNNINATDGIQPGQVIRVADPLSDAPAKVQPLNEKSSEIIHEVKSSETLYSVARKYGVTIKELMDWNHKTDFGLSPGEKLKIIQRP